MTRLIDADKLKKDLKSVTLSNGTLLNTNTILLLLDKYPIAYDVDKVVKNLESENRVISCVDNEFQRGAKNGHNCALNMAIEIVKRGGKNE